MEELPLCPANQFLRNCCILFSRFLKCCTPSGQGRAEALRVSPYCPGFAGLSSLSEDLWLKNKRKHERANEHGAALGWGSSSFWLCVFTHLRVLISYSVSVAFVMRAIFSLKRGQGRRLVLRRLQHRLHEKVTHTLSVGPTSC